MKNLPCALGQSGVNFLFQKQPFKKHSCRDGTHELWFLSRPRCVLEIEGYTDLGPAAGFFSEYLGRSFRVAILLLSFLSGGREFSDRVGAGFSADHFDKKLQSFLSVPTRNQNTET